ncbi:MAG: hypothetical protein KC506_03285, partial [Nanoarchaeota archaeon]|nr:hypothetical protein [Nanoarchaeota archaeon]
GANNEYKIFIVNGDDSVDLSCLNSESSFTSFGTVAYDSGSETIQANSSIPASCLTGDTLALRYTSNAEGGGTPTFYEEQVWWNITSEIIDLSSYSNNGTFEDVAEFSSSGKFGGSLVFDGVNGSV